MGLGIHKFDSRNNHSAYFIERPFGNILAFGDDLEQVDHEFIKSKGGLFRQFFESKEGINCLNRQLFKKYGANGVLKMADQFDPIMPLKQFGVDIADPAILFNKSGSKNTLVIRQKNKNVMILGAQYFLQKDKKILFNNQDITESTYKLFGEYEITHAFFTHFEDDNNILIRSEGRMKKIVRFFKELVHH